MYGYVYKTTNLVNGKIYVGQHKAQTFTDSYKGSGKYLWRAIEKYGWDNFVVEFIESAESKQELNELEVKWIEKFDARNQQIGYNISKGGETWSYNWKGRPFSDSHCRHISEALKGKHPTLEQRIKMSNSRKGKKFSEEHKRHMSENFKKNYTDERRRKLSIAGKGRKMGSMSEEQKIRISNTLKEKLKDNGTTKGRLWVTNGREKRLIEPKFLNEYLSNGFVKGMRFENE